LLFYAGSPTRLGGQTRAGGQGAAVELLKHELQDEPTARKRYRSSNETILEDVHQHFPASLEHQAQGCLSAHNTLNRGLGQEEEHRLAAALEVHNALNNLKQKLEEDSGVLPEASSDAERLVDSEAQERRGAINKLGIDLRLAIKTLIDLIIKEGEDRAAHQREAVALAHQAKAIAEKEGMERRVNEEEARKRHREIALLIASERHSARDLHSNLETHHSNLETQVQNVAKLLAAEKESRLQAQEMLKSNLRALEEKFLWQVQEVKFGHEIELKMLIENLRIEFERSGKLVC